MNICALAPNIYQVGGVALTHKWDAASYLVKAQRPVLIDCGCAHGFTALCDNLGQVGVSIQDLEMVIGTHGHYDHVDAAATLKKESGAKFALHRADAQMVEEADGEKTCAAWLYHQTFTPTKVDVEIQDDYVVPLQDIDLRVIHTPGHTPGSICVLARTNGMGILFCGDSLVGGFSPRIGSDYDAWRKSLVKLLDYSFDCLLLGHTNSVLLGSAKQRVEEVLKAMETHFFAGYVRPLWCDFNYYLDPLVVDKMIL